MLNQPWWRGAVIYQVYPRSFFDTNGDGIGDITGVIAKLDHIADLGADAIWLCPVFVSPQRDFGYDVSDHRAIDPIYGTLEDFDALIAAAHARGLRVLIDQVIGHTSNEHAWFRESRTRRDGTMADWYVWADPAPDGTAPNNWLSVFGGTAWTWEPRRRQYYLHHFLSHQPALNLRHGPVLDAVEDTARFWLDRGVDGFRLDAIDFLAHDPHLRSNPPAPAPDGTPVKLFALQNHVHDMLHPDGASVLARLRALTDTYPDACLLGEISSQPGAFERVMAATAGDERLHMAYTLRPLRGGFDWATLRALLTEVAATGDEGWPCWSFSNHDVERAATRWAPGGRADPNVTRQLLAMLLSLRGSVSLYQGEELGLPEAALRFEDLRDPFGIAYWPEFRGRDGSRTPIPWESGAPAAGFTTGTPWLPVPASHVPLAVDRQTAEAGTILQFARHFLAWRRSQPALRVGTLRPLALAAPLIGFERALAGGGGQVLALFNVSDRHAAMSLADYIEVHPVEESGFAARIAGGTVLLPPHGAFFANVIPARQWEEEAALAFA